MGLMEVGTCDLPNNALAKLMLVAGHMVSVK